MLLQVLVLQVLVLSRALHMALHDSMLVVHLARTCLALLTHIAVRQQHTTLLSESLIGMCLSF